MAIATITLPSSSSTVVVGTPVQGINGRFPLGTTPYEVGRTLTIAFQEATLLASDLRDDQEVNITTTPGQYVAIGTITNLGVGTTRSVQVLINSVSTARSTGTITHLNLASRTTVVTPSTTVVDTGETPSVPPSSAPVSAGIIIREVIKETDEFTGTFNTPTYTLNGVSQVISNGRVIPGATIISNNNPTPIELVGTTT